MFVQNKNGDIDRLREMYNTIKSDDTYDYADYVSKTIGIVMGSFGLNKETIHKNSMYDRLKAMADDKKIQISAMGNMIINDFISCMYCDRIPDFTKYTYLINTKAEDTLQYTKTQMKINNIELSKISIPSNFCDEIAMLFNKAGLDNVLLIFIALGQVTYGTHNNLANTPNHTDDKFDSE